MKKILIFAFALIVISNLPIFSFFIREDYSYSNGDGTFKFVEDAGKGASFKTAVMRYGIFLCQHPEKDQGDNRLFRTFTLKPWRFWEWGQWIFRNERFSLPYKDPKTSKVSQKTGQ